MKSVRVGLGTDHPFSDLLPHPFSPSTSYRLPLTYQLFRVPGGPNLEPRHPGSSALAPTCHLGVLPLPPCPCLPPWVLEDGEGGVEHDIFAFDHLSLMSRGVSVLKLTTSLQKKGL